MTEVVYALGAQSLLVATDTTSLYPAAALQTPKVGYLRQLSAEGLLSLQPDLIIGSGEAGPPLVLEQVRAAGVPVELVATRHSLQEVLHKVELVGRVTARVGQAQLLSQAIQRDWAAVQRQVAAAPRRVPALFILAHTGSPMVAGTATAADALLGMAGAANVAAVFAGYRPLTAEAMAALAPEVLVTTTQGLDAMGGLAAFWRRPELALTPAYAQRALVVMEASLLLGFGPRLPQTVEALYAGLRSAASRAP